VVRLLGILYRLDYRVVDWICGFCLSGVVMDLRQMEEYVISPALQRVGLWSEGAVRLMLNTGWVESKYRYVAQVGGGPARSFWQVERATMQDHYTNYLDYNPDLRQKVDFMVGDDKNFQLTFNMGFAVIMGRLVYWRSKTPMPHKENLEDQAKFWKQTYNTPGGAGTVEKFIEMCKPIQQEL